MPSTHFDIAIIGAGAAGLHLAMAMRHEAFFAQKRILILDKSVKNKNDKTWCFWERDGGLWDSLLHKSWTHGNFYSKEKDIVLALAPYRYKMLRSIDFYQFAKREINSNPIFTWQQESVLSVENGAPIQIKGTQGNFTSDYVFDSRIPINFFEDHDKYARILQHFKGWIIRTEEDAFDPNRFTMMDFRLLWDDLTSFTYVLPLSKREALVEFTLFTPLKLQDSDYDQMLKRYINEILQLSQFEILEQEEGVIPMSDFPFEKYSVDNHIRIGTGGGWVKPSTGYSFKNCERNSKKIIENLKSGRAANKGLISKKFRFYDALLLDILKRENELGPKLFEILYSKCSVQKIFSFLDDNTSLAEDLSIMYGLPWSPFLRAFTKYISR
jgi:lycopene beta-cyclase